MCVYVKTERIYTYIYIERDTHIRTYTCVYIYTHTHIDIYIYIYITILYIYIYIHISCVHTKNRQSDLFVTSKDRERKTCLRSVTTDSRGLT